MISSFTFGASFLCGVRRLFFEILHNLQRWDWIGLSDGKHSTVSGLFVIILKV